MSSESTLKIGARTFYGGSTTPANRRFRLQKFINKTVQKALTAAVLTEVKRKIRPTKRAKAKLPEEPEILTLSSDDEDKTEDQADIETEILANGFSTGLDSVPHTVEGTEEQDSSDEHHKHTEGVEGGGMMEQAMDGSIEPPHVMLLCRTVRIGSYKAKPCDKVAITTAGIELQIPLPENELESVKLLVTMSDIKRALVSFSRAMPVLFIYLNPSAGAEVRGKLKMVDPKSNIYYDPEANDQTQKRITMLPEKMSEEAKINIKIIFSRTRVLMTEIAPSIANDILVQSSPRENLKLRSVSAQNGEIQTIMVYPPPPAKGGISINTEDYACLGEDMFLNDVIIDFYLKYLMQSVLSEEDRERTHVFSSFFYKRLTSRPKIKGRRSHPIEDDPKLSAAEKRHARVKGWTKNVNLFSKDFIIIPINENCHWFLAIICFPGQNGCLRMRDNMPVDPPPSQSAAAAAKEAAAAAAAAAAATAAAAAAAASTSSKIKVKDNIMSIGSTTITPVKAAQPATITLDCNHGDDGSDRDEAEGDEDEMDDPPSEEEDANGPTENNGTGSNSGKEETVIATAPAPIKGRKPAVPREGIKQPCILIFDSLMGAPRYKVVATLRDYLRIEYKVKEGADKEKDFSKDSIKGMMPKVPQQNNFTDCGLYLLHYVESFFTDPIQDYHYPIKSLKDWFTEAVVTRKRHDIMVLLQQLMKEQNIDLSSINLPVLTFSHINERAEDEEATARLAAADAEADAEVDAEADASAPQTENIIYTNQELAECPVPDTAAEEIVTAGNESLQRMPKCTENADEPTDGISDDSEEVKDGEEDLVNSTVSHNTNRFENCESVDKEQRSLVDYSESSSDSLQESTGSCSIKRLHSGNEIDETIQSKKRKGLNER